MNENDNNESNSSKTKLRNIAKISSFLTNLTIRLHVYIKYKMNRNFVLINTCHLCQHQKKKHYRKYKT